jgi:pentatricopeptide repeat protein
MVQMFGKSKQIKDILKIFEDMQNEGLQPDESIKKEHLRAYVIADKVPEAIELYKEIQKSGPLDKAARSILFHGLNDEQKLELAAYEKAQGYDWS